MNNDKELMTVYKVIFRSANNYIAESLEEAYAFIRQEREALGEEDFEDLGFESVLCIEYPRVDFENLREWEP